MWQEEKNRALSDGVAALCAARRAAGVRANSKVKILAAESDCYVARVVGDEQELTVKLGPRYDLPPDLVPEKGHEWELVAAGNEYAVWARPRNAKGDAKSAR
jgi:alpha-amylase